MSDGLLDRQQSDGHIVQPSARRRNLACCVAVVVALIVASPYALGSGSDSEDSTSETRIITLQPGNNFIGWVGEAIGVEEVFAAIPEAKLIYHWDASSRAWRHAIRGVGGSLTALEPGVAAMIRINGARPVQWKQPLTPVKGMVTLYRGVNWVTWVGRDEWPLDQVMRGIGKSLVSIRVGDVTHPAPLDNSVDDLPTLRRGDALEVTVSRDLRWLQPTGIIPKVVWAGEPSQSLREDVNGDVRAILDFLAEKFAVETDFSETTMLLFTSVDAAVEHQASGAEPRLHGTPEELRVWLNNGSIFVATSWGFYMSACQWQPPCPPHIGDPGKGTLTLAHELFHILQVQLAGQDSHRPVWMSEGSATWAEWQLPAELRGTPYETERQWRHNSVARTTVPILFVEEWNDSWPYHIGSLAAERLAELSGEDALLEFYRRLHPQAIGAERRWVQQPVWEEAFQEAFGLSVSGFYGEFSAWRETLPKPAVRYDYDRNDVTLSGSLSGSNGSPAAGFRVNAASYEGKASAGLPRRAIVHREGEFSIDLAPMTTQRIWFTRDGCTLWLTDDGLTTTMPESRAHRLLNTRNLQRLDLELPAGACSGNGATSIEVEVLRLRGDDRRVSVSLDSDSGHISGKQHRDGETYSLSVPHPGRYRVRVRVGGCDLWYAAGGLIATREKPDPIELGDHLVSLKVRVPHDLCVRQISGRLIEADGAPLSGVWLAAYEGWKYGGAFPDTNGEFTITVPDSGIYQLSFEVDDCRFRYSASGATNDWQRASPITVADSDVTGIEFRVPQNPADLCR